MPCLVEFCRRDCLVLPEGVEVIRASGAVVCEKCGKKLQEHRKFSYPTGMRHCVRGCDGRFYHL